MAGVELFDGYYGDYPGRWFTADLAQGYRQTWASFIDPGSLWAAHAAMELGAPVIGLVRTGEIELLDARSKSPVLTFPIEATEPLASEVRDIDLDGDLEIAICDSTGLFVHDLSTGVEIAARYGFGCTDLAIGPIDGDPPLELVLAGNPLGGFVLDGSTFALEWAHLDGFGERVALGNADGDPYLEIVSNLGSTSGLQVVDPGTGLVLWSNPDIGSDVFEVDDLEDDGSPELLYSDYYNEGVQVVALTTGSYLRTIGGSYGSVYSLGVANVDGAGAKEIVWLGSYSYYDDRNRVFVANAVSGEVLHVSPSAYGPFLNLMTGNFDVDASAEIMTVAEAQDEIGDTGIRLLRFGAATGAVESMGTVDSSGGARASRALATQLDADPQPEICLLFDGYWGQPRIRCQDSLSGDVQWTTMLPPFGYPGSFAIAELDGDPTPELVVGSDENWILAFEGESGWLKWGTPPLPSTWTNFAILRVGDVVGDAGPEVVAGGVYYSGGAEIVVVDGATGALAAPIFQNYPAISAFDLAQRDADDQLEIVAAYSNGTVAEFDPITGASGPTITTSQATVFSLQVADVSRDGVTDLVLAESEAIRVWGGAEQSTLWTSPVLGDSSGAYDSLWVGDIDRDSVLEIAINTVSGLAVFEAPLFELLVSGFEAGDTSEWSSTFP